MDGAKAGRAKSEARVAGLGSCRPSSSSNASTSAAVNRSAVAPLHPPAPSPCQKPPECEASSTPALARLVTKGEGGEGSRDAARQVSVTRRTLAANPFARAARRPAASAVLVSDPPPPG